MTGFKKGESPKEFKHRLNSLTEKLTRSTKTRKRLQLEAELQSIKGSRLRGLKDGEVSRARNEENIQTKRVPLQEIPP